MTANQPERVIIRRYIGAPQDLIAIFPDICESGRCARIQHNYGKHLSIRFYEAATGEQSHADYTDLIRLTRAEDYASTEVNELLERLRNLGYNPRLIRRGLRGRTIIGR